MVVADPPEVGSATVTVEGTEPDALAADVVAGTSKGQQSVLSPMQPITGAQYAVGPPSNVYSGVMQYP